MLLSKMVARTSSIGLAVLCMTSASFAQTFTGPTVYTRAAQSPLFGTAQVGVAYFLEDFEDGLINTPGLSISPDGNVVINAPSATTDSVDVDDFAVDGDGSGGSSLTNPVTGVITLLFDEATLGSLPTKVGFVFTDGTQSGNITLTVINGSGGLSFNTFTSVGDAANDGATAEDRFMGVELLAGIAQIQVAASGGTVEIKDRLNGDTNSDIALHNSTTNAASVWFMNGITKIGGGPTNLAPLAGWEHQGMGDFNDDGIADILWRDASDVMRIWLMNGQSVTTSSAVINANAIGATFSVIGIADINGDGKADVLFRNSATDLVHAWIMNGVTRTSGGTIGSVAGLETVGTGDVNGDGMADLILRDGAGVVSGWLLDGLTVAASANIGNAGAIPGDWVIQAIGDLDGDGRADLVWRNTVTGQVNGWLLESLYRKQGGAMGTITLDWTLECTADLNGNTKGDLIWTNSTTGQINGWIMNGLIKVSGGNINTIPTTWSVVNR